MTCKNCGNEIKAGSRFCSKCGTPAGEPGKKDNKSAPEKAGGTRKPFARHRPLRERKTIKQEKPKGIRLSWKGGAVLGWGFMALWGSYIAFFDGIWERMDRVVFPGLLFLLVLLVIVKKIGWLTIEKKPGANEIKWTLQRFVSFVGTLIAVNFIFIVAARFLLPLYVRGLKEYKGVPVEIQTPGIWIDRETFRKETFIENEGLGAITDLKVGSFFANSGKELAVVGSRGALFFQIANDNPTPIFRVSYPETRDFVRILALDQEGGFRFYSRGAGNPVSIDREGLVSWAYGDTNKIMGMTAGDVDKDGEPEFAVGSSDSVDLLNSNGTKRWGGEDSLVWDVAMADADRDGGMEIVHSNAGGQIIVRDHKGKILSSRRPFVAGVWRRPYFHQFSITNWPDKSGSQYALIAEYDKIWILDFYGYVKAVYKAPFSRRSSDAAGTPVRFAPGKPPYFAVVVWNTRLRNAMLYIYNHEKELVRHEALGDLAASILATDFDDSGKESLLVGGNGKVLRYRFY